MSCYKMGNEGSHQLNRLEINNEAIEVTNTWTLKHATLPGASTAALSVFISQHDCVTQLELASKKLKLYRHPGIVKYVDTWSSGGCLHLATERVVPLAQVLSSVSPLQACLGLRSVLRALVFLHNTAQVSHNNICCASIYVANDGTWKLGNFEFLCPFSQLTASFLQESKPRRYEPSIAPEDQPLIPKATDAFAYGRFVEEVMKHKEAPGELAEAATHFLNLATTQLQNPSPESRGDLATLLEHPYFSHPVVAILEFLSAITLKTQDEKENFFRSLWAQLATLPEVMVATQLADLLLSRLVLLESCAQEQLLPWLLAVRQDDQDSGGSIPSGECVPIFSRTVFEKHVTPRLARIFQVRDSEVRSVLLRHFSGYCHTFTLQQLQEEILPELLVGIKDESDALVADTLRALADLVPLLGATIVVGGKRGRLFTDGRPKVRVAKPTVSKLNLVPPKVQQQISHKLEGVDQEALPERLSPDGGEAWSDWDDQQDETDQEIVSPVKEQMAKPQLLKPICNDLDSLDIKVAKITALTVNKEVDFFQDMEPVISSARTLLLNDVGDANQQDEVSFERVDLQDDKFKVVVEDVGEEEGWGEDSDWPTQDETTTT